MCRLNLNFKILGDIQVSHTWGLIIFHHVQAEFNFKILVENQVVAGGVIIFHHVQAES